MCLEMNKIGPFRCLFIQFLVIRVSYADKKAIEMVDNETLWCPTIVSIKIEIIIEGTKPLEASNCCFGNYQPFFDPF